MSNLKDHLFGKIDTLIENVEFDESVYLLRAIKSSIDHAVDRANSPMGHIFSEAVAWSKVNTVLATISFLFASGGIPARGEDRKLIQRFLDTAFQDTKRGQP